MVFHPEAGWGGLPTRVQKIKFYNLETNKYSTTPPFSKKHLAGVILHYTFGGRIRVLKINLKLEIIFSTL
jgi:hypothetical protein